MLSDSTLGAARRESGVLLKRVFAGSYFRSEVVPYDRSIEICGVLKNVVSVAVGICNGSACVGDLLVSCISGRNYKCGMAMGSQGLSGRV